MTGVEHKMHFDEMTNRYQQQMIHEGYSHLCQAGLDNDVLFSRLGDGRKVRGVFEPSFEQGHFCFLFYAYNKNGKLLKQPTVIYDIERVFDFSEVYCEVSDEAEKRNGCER